MIYHGKAKVVMNKMFYREIPSLAMIDSTANFCKITVEWPVT